MSTKKNSVLIVDDERSNISILRNILGADYTIYASCDGPDAIETAEEFLPDMILLDIIMPDMDGYSVLQALKSNEATKDIPVIFITGLDNTEAEEQGLSLGAVDFISKPFQPTIVKLRVQLQVNLVNHSRALIAQSAALQMRTDHLLRVQNSMASVLSSVVESRDKLTGKHIEQTAVLIKILLKAISEKPEFKAISEKWDIDMLASAARLHDIGKIAVSDLILNKPGRLNKEEYEEMKSHSIEGEKIIDDIIAESGGEDILYNAKVFAGSHHERWDGTGYPRGLRGNDIPLLGRIMAVADVYDALVSERSYKEAYSHKMAVEIIKADSGVLYDPQIIDIFLEVSDLFEKVI